MRIGFEPGSRAYGNLAGRAPSAVAWTTSSTCAASR